MIKKLLRRFLPPPEIRINQWVDQATRIIHTTITVIFLGLRYQYNFPLTEKQLRELEGGKKI